MFATQFLRRLPETVRPLLPEPLRAFQAQPRGGLLKLWYGRDAQIHFEVWAHERTQQLELGLHFEAQPERNEWLRRQFCARLIELKSDLGNAVEVEAWDRGWARLYETHPLHPLNEARIPAFAARAARFIAVVQPMYEEILREAELPKAR
jgi:hypothetical protein